MLEKPDLHDRRIISFLRDEYGLPVDRLEFLPLGADVNTAVYRVVAVEGTTYFLKLRKGVFAEISVTVPQFLSAQGLRSIIAPLQTRAEQNWASLDAFNAILYPFIEGRDGYQVALSTQQWLDFGAALQAIHSAQPPPELAALIPRETFTSHWRERVETFQAQAEETAFMDPVARKLAAFMRDRRVEIDRIVARASRLGADLHSRDLKFVLCHSDMHAGNLLLEPNGGLYIVDWDNPLFAPKERDLALVGGCAVWKEPREAVLFYQGYGQVEIDPSALAYYRCERIVQDIAEFCVQLFSSPEGGADREQSYIYMTSTFLPGRDVEIALKTAE